MQNLTKNNRFPLVEDIVVADSTLNLVEAGKESNYSGLGVSPGIAIGVAYVHNPAILTVPRYRIEPKQVEDEQKRVILAAQKTDRQLSFLKHKMGKLPGSSGEELGFLLDAYSQMLKNSRLIRGVVERIKNELINSEAAVQTEIALIAEAFASMEDPYLASRLEDVRGVGIRLVRNLSKEPFQPFAKLPKNSVIIAAELTPADTALLDPKYIAGFATAMGGAQSHTGLLARSLGLPAVIGAHDILNEVRTGDPVIIDGTYGLVIVCPTKEVVDRYMLYREDFMRWRESLGRLRDLPPVTTDGKNIVLKGNIDLPSETEVLLQSGAQGIGLLRTEYMFMNRSELPTADEQFEAIRNIVQRMNGQPVTIRTLDVGGDKPSDLVAAGTGPNPALGLRGIRCSLKWPELLKDQLSALLRASVYGSVKIMLPMIGSLSEVWTVKKILHEVAEKLRADNVPIPDQLPPLGVMIEIPSAALIAETLAKHVDFFSIGTNDLTQYVLAVDRTDEKVDHLYNTLHPAVLKLIQMTANAAQNAGIPVAMCGEMAASPRNTMLLLGLGVHELSMPATNIPTVKERIRSVSLQAAKDFANKIMASADPDEIDRFLNEQW